MIGPPPDGIASGTPFPEGVQAPPLCTSADDLSGTQPPKQWYSAGEGRFSVDRHYETSAARPVFTRNDRLIRYWSERDCGLRFALELEREWPQEVHEFAIGKASRADYDKTTEGFQRVDVAVSDLSAFIEDDGSFDRFRSHRHQAFFEVKWFVKGWGDNRDARSRLADVLIDVAKLANHLRLGRCAVAGMLVVDDAGYFDGHGSTEDWPQSVWRLYVGPWALRRRRLLPVDL